MAACHAHPAYVDDPATWLNDDPAGLLRRQSGREYHPAGAHGDLAVPADDVDGTVVIPVALHAAGQVAGRAPAAVKHGASAQPVRDLAF